MAIAFLRLLGGIAINGIVVELEDSFLGGKVNIALIQLKNPFYNELQPITDLSKNKLYYWKEIENRRLKIISILENIKESFKEPSEIPDIIVFPEYSVPNSILPDIKKFSKYFKIIIAGSDQIRDPQNDMYRKNICSVFVHNHGEFFVEKNTPMDEEIGKIKEGDLNKSTLELHWKSPKEEELCIQIYICLDYLTNSCDLGDRTRKGCIIVPMCSKSMKEFVGRQYSDVRSHKFVILCNVAHDREEGTTIVGNSAIYGAEREIGELDDADAIISINDKIEGVIIARLNLENPYAKKPTSIRPVIPVETKNAFELANDFTLSPIRGERERRSIAIINPCFFLHYVKPLNIFFQKSKRYAEARNEIKKIQNSDFASFGVLGINDIISLAFIGRDDCSEKINFLKKYSKLPPECTQISKIFKFYGSTPKIIPSCFTENLSGNNSLYSKLLKLSEDWNSVSKEERDNLLKNNLILGKYDKIDPKSVNMIQAFLCLELKDATQKDFRNFERIIIENHLKPIKGINSIYKGQGHAGVHFDYLLDLIDTPHSIFDIIVTLHSKSEDQGFEIETNTYMVVEQLSQGLFNAIPKNAQEDIFELSPEDIIAKGEGENIEFKSSLRYNLSTKSADKTLELVIAKVISSFMNKEGGVLLIGIDDEGIILGLNNDFSTLRKRDKDGFELQLNRLLNKYLGAKYLEYITTTFYQIHGNTICKVIARRSREPVYLDNEGTKELYVRMGNQSIPMKMDEGHDYISTHWHK